jgi:hypothetical protein
MSELKDCFLKNPIEVRIGHGLRPAPDRFTLSYEPGKWSPWPALYQFMIENARERGRLTMML